MLNEMAENSNMSLYQFVSQYVDAFDLITVDDDRHTVIVDDTVPAVVEVEDSQVDKKGVTTMNFEKNILMQLKPDEGKTKQNIDVLLAFLDSTGGNDLEPDFNEKGEPLTRAFPSLSTLKGGITLGRMPIRVARRMAQGILKDWQVL